MNAYIDILKKYISKKITSFFLVKILSLVFGVFFDYAIINASLGRVPKLSK
jgi:hypothetical protein|tara:strand:- start:33275 stop:33427 length:153 start_codon:yes stop_codon:yes gene_type:complete